MLFLIVTGVLWTAVARLGLANAEGAPRIQPFSFSRNVTFGQKIKTMCTASGKEPLSFQWHKDGLPIYNSQLVKIQDHDDYTVLTLPSADYNSPGNFTCTVKNSDGMTSYSAQLLIHAPPKWVREPQDWSVGLEGRVSLDCEVRGHPRPIVSWSTLQGDDRIPLKSTSRHHVAENGSLIISDVRPEDAGKYECRASNGIGNGLTKLVALSVHVPARFENKFGVESVRWGETATLRCEALGDGPVTLTWTKDHAPVSEKQSNKYEVYDGAASTEGGGGGTWSELHVQATDREDNGLYVCVAKNAFGKDERTVKLVVLEVPGPPSEVRVEQTWSESAALRWALPYGGNSPLSAFVVQYWRDAGAPHRLEETSVPASQTSTLLKGLQPGASYVARVLAENDVGRGNPSESQQFLTKEAEPFAPPTDVVVESRGAGTLRVKWKSPPRDQWNGQLKGYYLGWQAERAEGEEEPYSFRTVEARQGQLEHLLTDLRRATQYRVIVQAFNGAGTGPPSAHVSAKTSDTDPPTPPFVWVAFQSRSSIGLKWKHRSTPAKKEDDPKDAPTASPAPIHYTVLYKEEYGPWSEVSVPGTARGEWALSGLREGTRYQLYMKASAEGAGDSDPSDVITVRTEGGALSDMSQHEVEDRASEETPAWLKLPVLVPLAASASTILIVLLGACLYVGREQRRYKADMPGGPDRQYSYGGSCTLPSQRRGTKEEKAGRALLRGPLPPQPPPGGYPAPYATMPIRAGCAIKTSRRPSDRALVVAHTKNGMLQHATMDRKRMAGLTIEETAEVHYYDMAA